MKSHELKSLMTLRLLSQDNGQVVTNLEAEKTINSLHNNKMREIQHFIITKVMRVKFPAATDLFWYEPPETFV